MTAYVLAAEARADLVGIWEHLVESAGPSVADQIVNELHVAMLRLSDTPRIGHRRQDLTLQPVRFLRVRSYLIVYHEESSPLAVVRVLHGSRDIESILAEG